MAVYALGTKQWEVAVKASEIDEDTEVLLIDLSLMPPSFWTAVNATDGRDIRVVGSDKETQLACNIIGFADSGTTGVGWLRVTVAVSTSVNGKVYVLVGDAGASMPARDSTYGSESAYDADVAGAWEFDGGSLTDSTSGERTLTNNNSATAGPGPKAGMDGYTFVQSSSQYLSTTSPPVTGLPAQIETWTYTADNAVEQCPVTLGNSASAGANLLAYYVRGNISNDPTQTLSYGGGGSGATPLINNHPYSSWSHDAVARDAVNPGTSTINRNGTTATSTASLGTAPTYNRFFVGALHWSGANTFWKGDIGWTFVHSAVRSANYLATVRNMINAPATVLAVGAMEEAPGTGETDWTPLGTVSGSAGWANGTYALGDLWTAATDTVPAGDTTGALNLVNLVSALSELTGSTPTGIALKLVATGQDLSTRELVDATVRLIVGGTVVGSNKASATQWEDTTLETRIYGGAGDLWGLGSIDPSDIQGDTFGISLAFENIGPSLDALMSVYQVQFKIYYTAGGGSDATASGAIDFGGVTFAGDAHTEVEASGAIDFGGVTFSGTAPVDASASGAIEFDGVTFSGDADVVVEASGAIEFGGVTFSGTAPVDASASGAIEFGGVTFSGGGDVDATASGAIEFDGVTFAGTAEVAGVAATASGAIEFEGITFAGDSFVFEGPITSDALAWFHSGAGAESASQRDQAASLGGYRSGTPLRVMTWDMPNPLVGIEVLEVGGGNGRGAGMLTAVDDDLITWTPPGGTAGPAVTLAYGAEATLYGFGGDGWIRVRRRSTFPISGPHTVKCIDLLNNAIGFGNVASADAIAGATYYRAVIGRNRLEVTIVEARLWLDAAYSAGLAIAFEALSSGAVQSIADEHTAPTGLTWVTGTTRETGLVLGPVAPGDGFGLWIRRTVAADADPAPYVLNQIHVEISEPVNTFTDALRGMYHVAREDYETWGLWYAQDALPDLSGPPNDLFTSKPFTTSAGLDPSHTYNALVRWRNKWGLWSPNTETEPLVMDATGEQDFNPPSGPSLVTLTQTGDNEAVVGMRYEPAVDGDNRGEIFVVWLTADDTAPDPGDAPSAYVVMGRRAGIEVAKWTDTVELLDGTPVQALVRVRRIAVLGGDPFAPDTTQLPASGAGTIVVATELTGWDSTGFLKVMSAADVLQEVIEYDSLVVGAGISTFTVLSGGRGLWGTTAAATATNTMIYPVVAVDSENTTATEGEIDGMAPARPWGELLSGDFAGHVQAPIAGPDGVTEEYISVPHNIYLLLGEGWAELWMDTDLVWKVFQDGNNTAGNALYIPSEWDLVADTVSGAGTGVFEATGATDLYLCAGTTRRMHIDGSAMTITAEEFSSLGGLPEVAPQSATWEQYAGSLLQAWDPAREDYRPFAQISGAGVFTSEWDINNSLTQAEIVAL